MTNTISSHAWHLTAAAVTASVAALLAAGTALAQTITVVPVNVALAPKQMATTLTVMNHGDAETSVQVRAVAWKQQSDGSEQLTPSDALQVSPPIATIAAGGTQVVRLVLRKAPVAGQESTYRILLDQIPPAGAPGTVRIALRLSIPVFAEPATRTSQHVKYHIDSSGGQAYLVAVNDGGRHETLHDIALTTGDGIFLKTTTNASPYILAGATRRWPITDAGQATAAGATLRLTGTGTGGAVDERILVAAAGP